MEHHAQYHRACEKSSHRWSEVQSLTLYSGWAPPLPSPAIQPQEGQAQVALQHVLEHVQESRPLAEEEHSVAGDPEAREEGAEELRGEGGSGGYFENERRSLR